MGILSRFQEIMKSNINDTFDNVQAKDMEKQLTQFIFETESSLGQIKAQANAVQAAERTVQQKLDDCESEMEKYRKYSAAALENGDEAQAKKFIHAANELVAQRNALALKLQSAHHDADRSRRITEQLEQDLFAARNRLTDYRARLERLQSSEKGIFFKKNRIFSQMDQMEQELQRREDIIQAKQELNKTLDDEIAELEKKYAQEEADSQIPVMSDDEALEQLKKTL